MRLVEQLWLAAAKIAGIANLESRGGGAVIASPVFSGEAISYLIL